MKNKKRFICCLVISAFSITLAGCENSEKENEGETVTIDTGLPQEKQTLRVVDGVNFNYNKTFFDDFTNGVEYN